MRVYRYVTARLDGRTGRHRPDSHALEQWKLQHPIIDELNRAHWKLCAKHKQPIRAKNRAMNHAGRVVRRWCKWLSVSDILRFRSLGAAHRSYMIRLTRSSVVTRARQR